MSELIPDLPSISSLPEIPDFTKPKWEKPPVEVDLVLEPEIPGSTENVLEAAAVQYGMGTLPERIVWKWLIDQNLVFQVQYAEFGGQRELGGAVLDFRVFGLAAAPVAFRVQGGYWHGPSSDRKAQDDEQAGRLRLAGYLVVDLWEQPIYDAVRGERLTEYIMWRIV